MIITIDEKGNEALDGAMIARQGPQQSNIEVEKLGGKSRFQKRQYQDWDTLRFVLILRITFLAYWR